MSTTIRQPHTFGIKDYWNMFRKRGLRLPLNYFLNAHLFDVIHHTDTHTWLPKEDFTDTPPNFAHGVLYMVSWTREIQRSFQRVRKLVPDFATRTFIDRCIAHTSVSGYRRAHGVSSKLPNAHIRTHTSPY